MNMRFLKRMFKLEMTTKAQQNGCPNQGNVSEKVFQGICAENKNEFIKRQFSALLPLS